MILPELSDEEFVESMYETILNRSHDEEGKQNHVDAIKHSDATRLGIVARMIESKEYIEKNDLDVLTWYDGKVVNSNWKLHKSYYLEELLKSVDTNKDSNIVEIGVWRGRSAKVIASTVDSNLFLFDTFDGFPEDDCIPYDDENSGAELTLTDTSKTLVENRLSKFSNDTHIFEGDIRDTHIHAPETISFLHVDVDSYHATKSLLNALFNKVKEGGIILLDEYGMYKFHEYEHKATNEFFEGMEYSPIELPTGQAFIIK